VVCFFIFRTVGAGFPVPWWYYLADSWIFVGSILATVRDGPRLGGLLALLARGRPGRRTELLHFHYYPSAILYAFYGGFVIWGFVVWLRISRRERLPRLTTRRWKPWPDP
jgi:nicotinamide mononucleotide transporter